jgi:hypothetical protein
MKPTWLCVLLLAAAGLAFAAEPEKKPVPPAPAKKAAPRAPAAPAKRAEPAEKPRETDAKAAEAAKPADVQKPGDDQKAGDDQTPKDADLGMSILGNQEAPKSLVIVPWKSSEIGSSIGIATMLDDSRQPIDKEVFMRVLSYYELTVSTTHRRKQ